MNANGLSLSDTKTYWRRRAAEQGERTVGFGGRPLAEQERNYSERTGFIRERLSGDLRTLDFGCGIGRYARLFPCHAYLGVDICPELLDIAGRLSPDRTFILTEPGELPPEVSAFAPQRFFTATVLQHNSDDGVLEILKSWRKVAEGRVEFFLYENCHDAEDKAHIVFREPSRYAEMLEEVFGEIAVMSMDLMVVHKETHGLLIAETEI